MFYERNTAVRLRTCGTVLWVSGVASDVQMQPANGAYDYYLVDLENHVQVVNEMKFDIVKQKAHGLYPPASTSSDQCGTIAKRSQNSALHATKSVADAPAMTALR